MFWTIDAQSNANIHFVVLVVMGRSIIWHSPIAVDKGLAALLSALCRRLVSSLQPV